MSTQTPPKKAPSKQAPPKQAPPKQAPPKQAPPKEKKEKKSSSWGGIEDIACFLGKWSWAVLIIEGLIFIIWALYGLFLLSVAESLSVQYGAYSYFAADIAYYRFLYIINLIGGILTIIFAIVLVKPRFSNKWADKDYDYLLNDVITLGNIRIPKFLIIGIIIEIFLQFWGGLIILIPLLLLIIFGPKEYKWKAS